MSTAGISFTTSSGTLWVRGEGHERHHARKALAGRLESGAQVAAPPAVSDPRQPDAGTRPEQSPSAAVRPAGRIDVLAAAFGALADAFRALREALQAAFGGAADTTGAGAPSTGGQVSSQPVPQIGAPASGGQVSTQPVPQIGAPASGGQVSTQPVPRIGAPAGGGQVSSQPVLQIGQPTTPVAVGNLPAGGGAPAPGGGAGQVSVSLQYWEVSMSYGSLRYTQTGMSLNVSA